MGRIDNAFTHSCQIFILIYSIRLQSIQSFNECLSIRSSHIRVLRPLPPINGCTTFISTYLSAISSIVVSGIRSIVGMMAGKWRQIANVKPPFEIFLFRICPANSYTPQTDRQVSVAHIHTSRFERVK